MYELTYNPNPVSNDYELSFKDGDRYIFMLNPDNSLNQDFLSFLSNLKSFRILLTTGTATARFERGLHWYAYKKVKGVLNKQYIGKPEAFTELLLDHVVSRLQILKSVTDKPKKQAKTKAKSALDLQLESATLAGHGKDDRLIQRSIPDIIPDDWNIEAEQWKRIASTYQDSCNMAWEKVDNLKKQLQTLEQQPIQLEVPDTIYDFQRSINSLQASNILLKDSIRKEKESFLFLKEKNKQELAEMQATIDSQANLIFSLREDIHDKDIKIDELKEEVQMLNFDDSKRQDDIQGYFFMHEEMSEKLFEYRTLIEKYKLISKDKDKRKHPRFSYLLDFLSEIDKLS